MRRSLRHPLGGNMDDDPEASDYADKAFNAFPTTRSATSKSESADSER